jgi:pimeloyl-ACP methyl ester carboxylesterase
VSQFTRTTFTVKASAGPLACTRWATPDSSRPTALLVHGTGFCASVWNGVARDLADDFDVVAFDRRGHGASTKPADVYDFDDFADDICELADALGLHGAYGIGHSAGGTDLLLAAPRRPDAFARLLLIEPTVMDPHEPTRDIAAAPGPQPAARQRRRPTFPSRQAAFDRLEGRGIFAGWQPELFDAYITDGFESLADGHVTLRCDPVIEESMLLRIWAAMDGTHPTETFECLNEIRCPVLIATTANSNPRYRRMADTARRHIENATIEHLAGLGHAAPQVAPERIASLARRFWNQTGGTPRRPDSPPALGSQPSPRRDDS